MNLYCSPEGKSTWPLTTSFFPSSVLFARHVRSNRSSSSSAFQHTLRSNLQSAQPRRSVPFYEGKPFSPYSNRSRNCVLGQADPIVSSAYAPRSTLPRLETLPIPSPRGFSPVSGLHRVLTTIPLTGCIRKGLRAVAIWIRPAVRHRVSASRCLLSDRDRAGKCCDQPAVVQTLSVQRLNCCPLPLVCDPVAGRDLGSPTGAASSCRCPLVTATNPCRSRKTNLAPLSAKFLGSLRAVAIAPPRASSRRKRGRGRDVRDGLSHHFLVVHTTPG